MKLFSLLSIVLLSVLELPAQEQIKRGVYSIGGSIYYSSTTTKDNGIENDQSSYNITPSISYFIADHSELSFSIGYQGFTINYTNPAFSDYKFNSLTLGLGIRYYFPAGNISPFIGASGGINWISYDSRTYSTPRTNYSFVGGLEIFISECAAVEPAIIYSKNRFSEQSSISGIQFGVGVKYFIL